MTSDATRPGTSPAAKDYRSLPADVELDATIATVDPAALPDPEAGRNTDQYLALRND